MTTAVVGQAFHGEADVVQPRDVVTVVLPSGQGFGRMHGQLQHSGPTHGGNLQSIWIELVPRDGGVRC